VDAIAHVVRDFVNDDIVHVENRIDPQADEQIVLLELIMADLATVEKKMRETGKASHGQDKQAAVALAAWQKIKTVLDAGKPARQVALTDEEKIAAADTPLLTAKPIMNVAEDQISRQPLNENEIVVSAKIESELSELDEEDAKTMLSELGLAQSGLDRLITASYNLLNLLTFFTSGPKETRAWTITAGTKAPQAAGKIHTDFERGFIRAEVIGYQDFVDCAGEQGAREKGLLRLEGKDYIMQDGDVCHFRFSV
jgi:ribosome-binding ATPase